MRMYKGIAVSEGIAVGTVYKLLQDRMVVPKYPIKKHAVSLEQERFFKSIASAREEIVASMQDNQSEKTAQDVVNSYLMMLDDAEFHKKVSDSIDALSYNAEWVVKHVMQEYVQLLLSTEDQYLRDRERDLHDVTMHIISHLIPKENDTNTFENPSVIFAYNFLSTDLIKIPRKNILGIVTDQGGKTSHTVIIAKAWGIPMLINVENILQNVKHGQQVIVDAHSGKLIVNPSEDIVVQYEEQGTKERSQQKLLVQKAFESTHCTTGGIPVSVQLNLDILEELDDTVAQLSDGVGLFRTEFFIDLDSMHNSEQLQYQTYVALLNKMGDKPVTIRTLDLGGDKVTNILHQEEENPLLGYRGIRFCLEHRWLFLLQLRALLRASVHGNLRILVPMVSSVREWESFLNLLETAKIQVKRDGEAIADTIQVGVMVEVPSIVFLLKDVMSTCDFISVGTNDLLQYIMAADRGNAKVIHLHSYFQPAFLRVLNMIFYTAHEANVDVAVCGEMASDMFSIPLLLGAGLRIFSVSPAQISRVITSITTFTIPDTRNLFEKALQCSKESEVSNLLKDFLS